MPKFDAHEYLNVDTYEEGLQAFHAVSGAVLFEFAREPRADRDLIIRNFIARTNTMARGVFALYRLGDYQDCWILFRCLLDRLFHLHAIATRNEFEVFEAWSFLEQYNAQNRVRSNPEFRGAVESEMFAIKPEDKERARHLSANPPQWRRPFVEDVAKSLNMAFLYRFGYDYASTHVHPMANDGWQDFYTITKLEPPSDFPDQRSALVNTLLVATMVVQVGLNASSLYWMALLYNCLDDLRQFIGTGSLEYRARLATLATVSQQGSRLSSATPGSPTQKPADDGGRT